MSENTKNIKNIKSKRGNPQYLLRKEDRTPEERRKSAAVAGKASGVARKRKKLFRDIFAALMESPVKNMSTGETVSTDEAIAMAQVARALKGNLNAAIFIRDTLGQKPSEKHEVTTHGDSPLNISLIAIESGDKEAAAKLEKALEPAELEAELEAE